MQTTNGYTRVIKFEFDMSMDQIYVMHNSFLVSILWPILNCKPSEHSLLAIKSRLRGIFKSNSYQICHRIL